MKNNPNEQMKKEEAEQVKYNLKKQKKMDLLTSKIEQEYSNMMRSDLPNKGEKVAQEINEKSLEKNTKYIPPSEFQNYKKIKKLEHLKKLEKPVDKIITTAFNNMNEKRKKTKEETEIVLDQFAEILKNNKIDQIIVAGEYKIDQEALKKDPKLKEKVFNLAPDFDARTALYALNNFNKKEIEKTWNESGVVSVVEKDGNGKEFIEEKEGIIIYLDTGGKWPELKIEKDGKIKTLYIDHHGKGKREATSGTKMMLETMKKADILKELPTWFVKFTDFVNDVDNLTYLEKKDEKGRKTFNENYFRNEWPNSLYALAEKKIPYETLIKLCKEGKIEDMTRPFTKEELDGEIGNTKVGVTTIKELCGKTREEVVATLNAIKNSIKHNKEEGLNLNSEIFGKIIYQDYFKIKGKVNLILDHLAFKATKAKQFDAKNTYDTYIAWNKRKNSFYINSLNPNLSKIVEKLNEKDPGCCIDIRGVMVMGKINKLTEEEFLDIIDPNILKDKKLKKETEKEEGGWTVENEKRYNEAIETIRIEKEKIEKAKVRLQEIDARLLELDNLEKENPVLPEKKNASVENTIKNKKNEELKRSEYQEKVEDIERRRQEEIKSVVESKRVEITDKNFNFAIFGVPKGFDEFSTKDKPAQSYLGYYVDEKERKSLCLEKRNNTFYYIYKRDHFLDKDGRGGSFIGMTIELEKAYITDTKALFELFDQVFEKFIVEKYEIIKPNNSTDYPYTFNIKSFEEVKNQIKEIRNIILKNLQNAFKDDIFREDENIKNMRFVSDSGNMLSYQRLDKSNYFDFDRNAINTKYDKELAELKKTINGTNKEGKKEETNPVLPEKKNASVENKEIKSYPISLIKEEIKKLLLLNDQIKKIKNFEINGKGDKIRMELDLVAIGKTFLGKVNVDVKINTIIGNEGDKVVIKDTQINAGILSSFVKEKIEPQLEKVSDFIKKYIEEKEGKKVEKIWIENGELKAL